VNGAKILRAIVNPASTLGLVPLARQSPVNGAKIQRAIVNPASTPGLVPLARQSPVNGARRGKVRKRGLLASGTRATPP